ncbi:hypothetical protein LOZ66_005311 [Ophidiomyces ophidiicola]|nr:hypothetical protein LOZ65_002104 [Ophidiomyces ophidiicola]KAI1935424.1 hypothetical protein LOZ66_005311 [Ophidiomyces ophidiicola]
MGKAAGSTFVRGKARDLTHPDSNGDSSRVQRTLQTNTTVTPNRSSQNPGPSPLPKNRDGPRNFEFVLVTDSESRRQVRRYAMRQYVHQRRLDGIARLESNKARVRGWSIAGTSTEGVSSAAEEEEPGNSPLSNSSSSSSSSVNSVDFGIPGTAIPEPAGMYPDCYELPTSDPQAGPSSGAMDPFQSLPLTLDKTEYGLIPHFITIYPFRMYKMDPRHQYNPIRAIFQRVAIHDPVPFQAMLAVSAKHMAGTHNQTENVLSLTHKMRALRLLNERLKNDTSGKEEGTIYSAASMAVIEKWSKDDNVENMHIRGLTQLLKKRGGMRGMRATSPTSHFMEKVLYWVDFSCAPDAIVGATFPWTGDTPDIPPTLSYMAPRLSVDSSIALTHKDLPEILQACENFFSFFHSLNELQQSLLARYEVEDIEGNESPPTPSFFYQTSPVYDILTSVADYDHGIQDISYIDEYVCVACLFYLNVALFDSYSAPQNFNKYLDWINFEVGKLSSYGTVSVASVLWIFLDNGGFPTGQQADNGERSWSVSQMLRVAKRLCRTASGTLWDDLKSTLLDFLFIHRECGIGNSSVGKQELSARRRWRHNQPVIIRKEAELRRIMVQQIYAAFPSAKVESIPC